MKTLLFVMVGIIGHSVFAQENTDTAKEIIALEKAALERWNRGDIKGYLELYSEDFTYFDPMLDKRMDGLKSVTEYYKPLEGNIHITKSEMIDPKVQTGNDMAVLTFNLKSVEGIHAYHWNCTEVYKKDKDHKWKIIQTHWSLVKPDLK